MVTRGLTTELLVLVEQWLTHCTLSKVAMALSSLEKLHINSSKLQLYHMQNVNNNTLQESREMISIMWTQSFVHRKKLKVVTVMVKVMGGDAGGNDSDGGPKKQEYERKGVATVTATYISIIGIVWGE